MNSAAILGRHFHNSGIILIKLKVASGAYTTVGHFYKMQKKPIWPDTDSGLDFKEQIEMNSLRLLITAGGCTR